MRLNCPFCGERDAGEFTFRGDATVARPPIDNDVIADHQAYVFDRKNPAGLHREYWHHAGGCRGHVLVPRNTVTHEVLSCEPVGPWKATLQKLPSLSRGGRRDEGDPGGGKDSSQ